MLIIVTCFFGLNRTNIPNTNTVFLDHYMSIKINSISFTNVFVDYIHTAIDFIHFINRNFIFVENKIFLTVREHFKSFRFSISSTTVLCTLEWYPIS